MNISIIKSTGEKKEPKNVFLKLELHSTDYI